MRPLALRIRGHLHGLVSLEVYGHMPTRTTSPEKLFQEELAQLMKTSGIPRRR
ncbi:TetR-like C-terminal domain-containing protein [Streptomyces cacaoi]|uniref:TetR-like C-terminal domain-containing protein n=1 Tax=Streptomyces cacaoi TaxID=1898 RepID=UPI003747F8CB